MPRMKQQEALELATAKFGHTAYTEHSEHYKLVGVKGDRKVFAVADTWEEAIAALERKLGR